MKQVAAMSLESAKHLDLMPANLTASGDNTMPSNHDNMGISLAQKDSALQVAGYVLGRDHGCTHIQFHKTEELLQSVRTLVAYSLRFRKRHHFSNLQDPSTGTPIVNFDKLPTPFCHTCHDCLGKLHACLHCIYIGCMSRHGDNDVGSSHILQHSNTRNHTFCMDFSTFAIYCSKCHDYVYDSELEEIVNMEKIRMNDLISSLLNNKAISLSNLEGLSEYSTWQPSVSEVDLMKQKSVSFGHLGLRGLRNVGNTCFMNVILQSLVHNPALRAFFLSDKHNRLSCSIADKTKCLSCQMDKLFSNFYSGEIAPIIPSDFLWAMWMSCKELVGYAQQDAHEFFIGVLNGLHQSLAADKRQHGSEDCCIVHSVFSGVFQSTVTCLNCGNQTVANDPFLDISLDVRPVFSPVMQSAVANQFDEQLPVSEAYSSPTPITMMDIKPSNEHRPIATSMKVVKNGEKRKIIEGIKTGLPPSETHTLHECLDRFTHKERLNWSEYKCYKCIDHLPEDKSKLGSLKQLSLKKVPLVLSLQLKRYDHGINPAYSSSQSSASHHTTSASGQSSDKGGSKLSMIVKFPLDLDLTRWTTRYIQQSPTTKSSLPIPNPSFEYTLFAVIVHIGTLQSGHYISYVRQSGSTGRWFKFDDHMVSVVEWDEVRQCEAYMLFYIKKTFEYQ